jgi:hypothetical protein
MEIMVTKVRVVIITTKMIIKMMMTRRITLFRLSQTEGPSADPESVDGTVFAGEKNIERNNGKDFDIKDVFNDCQVSMFND